MNILETERLVLCKFTSDDSEFILNLLNTPGWMKYIGDKGIKNLEDAQDYIRSVPLRSYDKYGFGLYLVKDKNDNTPLGMCGLIKREELEDVDLGFSFLPQYTGKGFAFESALAVLNYGKTSLGLKRIVAITDQDNYASIKLLEKLGLQFEKKITFQRDEAELMLFAVELS